jgi:hypothetical protein
MIRLLEDLMHWWHRESTPRAGDRGRDLAELRRGVEAKERRARAEAEAIRRGLRAQAEIQRGDRGEHGPR